MSGLQRHERVQNVRAVRVQHALGIAGGAGGVADPGGRVLVERLPGEIAVGLGEPLLVGNGVAQGRLRHMRGVREHDDALDCWQLGGDFQERHKSEIRHDHAVFRMIDDPGDLLGKQARIDRVVDGADAGDAVPGFQVAPGIPGQRRHAVAELDAVALEPLRHAQGTRADFRVVGVVHRPFDRPGNDRPFAMIEGGMIDDAMQQERPILHEPEHGIPPGSTALRCSCCIRLPPARPAAPQCSRARRQ